ncbi:MAG: PrsW family glutamic-type intramembrane protease, partial [Candidatus Peregrinibacteria bacterium]
FNLALLATVLFTLSSLIALMGTIFKTETFLNIRRSLKEESFDFMTVSVMIGILIYAEAFVQTVFHTQIIQAVLGTILFLGIIEEYIKHLIVRMVNDKKLRDIDDAITLSIMVGLAFALIETMIYAITTGDIGLIIYRAFLTLPIHIIASGIFGYYYGLSHFSKPIMSYGNRHETEYAGFLAKILKCKKSTVYAEGKMTEGLFYATAFHAVANVLFEISLAFLVVPLVAGGLILLIHLYKDSLQEWRLIKRKQA